MNNEIRNVFVSIAAGMVRNSPTLLKNIKKKDNYRFKEMSDSDADKCAEELRPYWEHICSKIQDGSLFNMKAEDE